MRYLRNVALLAHHHVLQAFSRHEASAGGKSYRRRMTRDQEGIAEAYRAPVADYEPSGSQTGSDNGYVVSTTKLVLLFVATFGLYGVYWFYKHWKHQQQETRQNIRPIARAIFSLFFVVQLFKAIDRDARAEGLTPSWQPGIHAGAFILVVLVGRGLDRMGGESNGFTMLDFVALLIPLGAVVPLVAAQKLANQTYGDPDGRGNAAFRAGNIVTLVLGFVLWALIGVALLLPDL
jgi:hypothetical protein